MKHWHISQRTLMRLIPLVLTVVYCLYVYASSGGITGATKKSASPGCTCHGLSPNPDVNVLISGPDTLSAGETGSYAVSISGGPSVAAGTDIAASHGTLLVDDIQLQKIGAELTHTSPKSFVTSTVTFAFKYTAPSGASRETLFANGNSVNLNGFNSGDAWNFAPNKALVVAGVSVTAPNGAESWTVGDVHNITWSSSFTSNVKIEYSTDNGSSWITVVASTPAALGSFAWTLPNTPTTQARVRVSDPNRPLTVDQSNAAFTIFALPSNLHVTSPNGGEQWVVGSTHNVTWGLTSVTELRVDYSLDAGASWTTAADSVPGSPASYSLTLPASPTASALVRIVSDADTTISDTSDAVFTLVIGKSLPVLAGWNMVSVPLTVSDARRSVLYPTATSGAFAYQAGYAQKETLRYGSGYWLKFASDQSVDLAGIPLPAETVAVTTGWNMIGSQSDPLSVAAVTSDPGGILQSQFYSYAGAYTVADSIRPGQGYWVKANQPGVVVLAPAASASSHQAFASVLSSELPPPPPGTPGAGLRELPASAALEQNYPNPFNPSTVIRYQLTVPAQVRLRVFNALGDEVATLVDGPEDAGTKSVRFDASGLASGVYMYQLQAGEFFAMKKLLVMK
jgi:hypothetical protein